MFAIIASAVLFVELTTVWKLPAYLPLQAAGLQRAPERSRGRPCLLLLLKKR